MNDKAKDNQDSDDLEALFDSIVSSNREAEAPAAESATAVEAAPAQATAEANAQAGSPEAVFNKIGHMTRSLHDTLRELGLDKNLEKAASSIPDARDRLNYVAAMTEQAAERVLNATDGAQPVVDKIESEAQQLGAEWQKRQAT